MQRSEGLVPECRRTNVIFPSQPRFKFCSQMGDFMEQFGVQLLRRNPCWEGEVWWDIGIKFGKGRFGGTLGFNLGRGSLVEHWDLIWVLVAQSRAAKVPPLGQTCVPPTCSPWSQCQQNPKGSCFRQRVCSCEAESLCGDAEQLLSCPQCPAGVTLPPQGWLCPPWPL